MKLFSLLLAWQVGRDPRPSYAAEAPDVFLGAALLSIMLGHHGATYGLLAEAQAVDSAAQAQAYAVLAGTIVVVFGIVLSIHPLTAVVYPILYGSMTSNVVKKWERSEVTTLRGESAR
jgi:hypothetical protein